MKEVLLKELQIMTKEELLQLLSALNQELEKRGREEEMVVYQHDCFGSSSHHLRKYKHWAKLVHAVDTSKSTGYAFIGDFLPVNKQTQVKANSIVVEVCGDTITAYRVSTEGKELISTSSTNRMVQFIHDVAAALK